MYLSSRDIWWAIECNQLIVEPRPEAFGCGYDETSIDLHLDKVSEAKVWNLEGFRSDLGLSGHAAELRLGTFKWAAFSGRYLVDPPEEPTDATERERLRVCRRGPEVIVRPGGFVLWTTKEKVGTPKPYPRLICFVNAKSTRARTGLLVHFTAPTIHAGWEGKVILEIANLGPFHFVLQENDVIAQLTVAMITSPPDLTLKKSESQTAGQMHATGASGPAPRRPRTRTRRQE